MRDHVTFYVNGIRHRVEAAEAMLTLTEYLRDGQHGCDTKRLTGTKVACAEGDCGACTVLVGAPVDDPQSLVYRSIDACIAFVFQMDGRHLVTVEGMVDGTQLSAVQTAMVVGHGSQCGFCTPGFVMAIHSLVEESIRSGNAEPLSNDSLRLGLSGNLCRCTGYQQILDAAGAIVPCEVASVAQRFHTQEMLEDIRQLQRESVEITGPRYKVAIPRYLDDLLELRAKHPDALIVAGATDLGVQYNHGKFVPTKVISTCQVAELDNVEINGAELRIGASATWDNVESVVCDHVPEYHQVLTRFGSPQVRHAGTLAGNLANASPIADSIPFHYVTGSVLELASIRGRREVAIEEFYLGYKQIDLASDEVIVAVRTPLPPRDVSLKLYKVSKRRDMDISTVTAAFWIREANGRVAEARVAVGGVGPNVVRLPQAERILTGSAFTLKTMQKAGRVARGEIKPISDVRGSDQYRLQLVENLFMKCYYDLKFGDLKVGSTAVGA